jgi:hypothetical protein
MNPSRELNPHQSGPLTDSPHRRHQKKEEDPHLHIVHPWVARTLFHCTSVKQGKVLSNSAIVEATKFVRPHKSRMRQYIINACFNGAQPTWSLIDIGGGYHLQSSEYENSPLSPFPSGILHFSLVAPPALT